MRSPDSNGSGLFSFAPIEVSWPFRATSRLSQSLHVVGVPGFRDQAVATKHSLLKRDRVTWFHREVSGRFILLPHLSVLEIDDVFATRLFCHSPNDAGKFTGRFLRRADEDFLFRLRRTDARGRRFRSGFGY